MDTLTNEISGRRTFAIRSHLPAGRRTLTEKLLLLLARSNWRADAFISYHPHFTNTAIRDTQCGSYWSAVFTFETTQPEKWTDKSLIPTAHTSHAAARCPGAIDALCLMYTTTKYTKEAMFPHTGTWTLSEFVLVGGDATSDNLPPRFSQIQYASRSPSLGIQQQIYSVLEQNARHVAAMTGCRASVRWITKTRVGLTNHTDGRSDIPQHAARRPAAFYRRGARLRAKDPGQSRLDADGEPVPR
jgi:metal-dependent amidase/aminoacylase/carboxypeptidase family protein